MMSRPRGPGSSGGPPVPPPERSAACGRPGGSAHRWRWSRRRRDAAQRPGDGFPFGQRWVAHHRLRGAADLGARRTEHLRHRLALREVRSRQGPPPRRRARQAGRRQGAGRPEGQGEGQGQGDTKDRKSPRRRRTGWRMRPRMPKKRVRVDGSRSRYQRSRAGRVLDSSTNGAITATHAKMTRDPGEVPDMAKTKSKLKFDFKNFLLKKGEYLAMGIAGFFLVLLMLWGITKWSSAKDPVAIDKELTTKASRGPEPDRRATRSRKPTRPRRELPAWVQGKIPVQVRAGRGVPADQSAVRPDRQARHQEGEPARPARWAPTRSI